MCIVSCFYLFTLQCVVLIVKTIQLNYDLLIILNVHVLNGKLEFVIQDGTRRYKSVLSPCLLRRYTTSAVRVTSAVLITFLALALIF